MTVTPPTIADLRLRLDAETQALTEARRAVADGRDVLLSQLDARVGSLCRAIEALPSDEAQTLIDDLGRLNNALDDLAAAVWSAMRRNPGARIFPFQLGRP